MFFMASHGLESICDTSDVVKIMDKINERKLPASQMTQTECYSSRISMMRLQRSSKIFLPCISQAVPSCQPLPVWGPLSLRAAAQAQSTTVVDSGRDCQRQWIG